MARPQGSRNQNYEQERERLATLIMKRLMEPDGATASLRALAASCQVSPPTLRHYFEDREGAIEAAFAHALSSGENHLQVARDVELGPAQEALTALLRFTALGWERFGVGDIFRCGLGLGLGHERLGPAYIDHLLEPMLQAFEQRLALHKERGELVQGLELRSGALILLSPLMMALIHQRELGGRKRRPLDLEQLIKSQVEAFMKAYGAEAPTASTT